MKIEDVSGLMESGTVVLCDGIEYYISACITRYGAKGWWYQLELHDLKANSITIAAVDEVKTQKPGG